MEIWKYGNMEMGMKQFEKEGPSRPPKSTIASNKVVSLSII